MAKLSQIPSISGTQDVCSPSSNEVHLLLESWPLTSVHRATQGCGLLKEQRGLVQTRLATHRALRGPNWQPQGLQHVSEIRSSYLGLRRDTAKENHQESL